MGDFDTADVDTSDVDTSSDVSDVDTSIDTSDSADISDSIDDVPEDSDISDADMGDADDTIDDTPDEIAEDTDEVEEAVEDGDELPEDADEIPEDTDEIEEIDDEVATESDELPEDADEIPEDTEEAPEEDIEVAEESDELPEDADEIPEDTEEAPEADTEVAEESDELPEDADEIPEDTEEAPEETEELPEEGEETAETAEETEELPEEGEETAEVAEETEELPEEGEENAEAAGETEELPQEGEETAEAAEETEELPQEGEETAEAAEDTEDAPKVLKRDNQEFIDSTNRNIDDILDVKADDYRDQGLSEEEISERLAQDKEDLRAKFLKDQFPDGDVSTDIFDSAEPKNYDTVADYMGDHNYSQGDFDTYSQDPQWRELMEKEYPDYELPPMEGEEAGEPNADGTVEYTGNDAREAELFDILNEEAKEQNDGSDASDKMSEMSGDSENELSHEDPKYAESTDGVENDATDEPKVLKRDEQELLEAGNRNIKDILDAKADDYRDKGYSEEEINQRLLGDREELQNEFLNDAFPNHDVSREVFDAIEDGSFNKDEWFFKKKAPEVEPEVGSEVEPEVAAEVEPESNDAPAEAEENKDTEDVKPTSKASKEMVDADEYNNYKEFYDQLDTMKLNQDYKDVIVDKYKNMDGDLKQEYKQYADQLKCLDSNYTETDANGVPQDAAYFNSEEGGFKFSQEHDLNNPLGAGNTFFHESAHMMDWLKGQESGGDNASYEALMTEAATEDYFDALDRISKDNNCDRTKAQEILSDELMNDPMASNCVSDVFGGVSYNQVSGAWGHSTEYWQNRGRDAVGKEAFAEITADRACGTTENMSFTQRYMPKTMAAYEKALKSGGKK